MIMQQPLVPTSLTKIKPTTIITAVCVLGLLGTTAHAQDAPPPAPAAAPTEQQVLKPPFKNNMFGIQIGTYLPSNAAAKSKFGESWTGYGLGLGPIYAPQVTRAISPDLTILSTKKKFTSAILIPVGVSFRKSLTPLDMDAIQKGIWPRSGAYVGGSVNVVAGQLRSNLPGDNFDSGFKAVAGGSVYAGYVVSEKFSLEARYFGMGKIQNYDFSGLSLSVGLRF